jgi:CBS domain-containing membrane protein
MGNDLRVRDVMSSDVFTLGRNDELSIADNLMKQERIRHLPVVDEYGDLCGIITQRDLFRGALLRALGYGSRAEEKILQAIVVKEVMSNEVYTTTPNTPIHEAAETMMHKQVGSLPVVDQGKLVGILTEGDFVKLATDKDSNS